MSEHELARKTHGTKLKRGEEYVAKLLNIDPPEMSRDDIDVTDHDSPDSFREWIPGLKDGGEVPIEGHLIPTNETQKGLLAALDVDEPEAWTIEFPTVPKLYVVFSGYVHNYKVGSAPVDGVMTFSCTIKVTGKPEILTDESAGLSNLTVADSTASPVSLAPAFDNETYEYFAIVGNAITHVNVTPTAADHTITVNGVEVDTGDPSGNIALPEGEIKEIKIKAWEEGAAPVGYVVKVYREDEI